LNLAEIGATLDKARPECDCSNSLVGATIHIYNHDGGLQVDGYSEKQWVYLHCSKCGYDWSIWKLLDRATRKRSRGSEVQVLQEALS